MTHPGDEDAETRRLNEEIVQKWALQTQQAKAAAQGAARGGCDETP